MGEYDPLSLVPFQAIVDRAKVIWPGGARLAVWVVPNIEHYHLNRFTPAPDIRNYSREDYGNRVGVWRVMDVLQKHGIRGSVALNGEVVRHFPRILEAALGLGWELMGHGTTNSIRLSNLPPDEVESIIVATKQAIESCGQRMRGWLGPGLQETWETPDLLRKHGVDYVCDWVNDDLPYRMTNGLFSIPYTLDLNDSPLFNVPSISIEDFQRRICDSFDVLYEEGATNGRVMCIALHPFLIGVPHRIKYLDKALAYVTSHRDVWLATGAEIIDAFRSQDAATATAS